jgi:hypothetical protein
MNARDVARELKREGWYAWAPFGAATAPPHGLSGVHERDVISGGEPAHPSLVSESFTIGSGQVPHFQAIKN